MSAPAGPYIVSRRQSCEDCHGTGERHPTTRGYMAHGRDCETCERRGDVVSSRWAYATLEEARARLARVDLFDVNRVREAGRCHDVEIALEMLVLGAANGRASATLPDGSEIVVEATTYIDLWKQCGEPSFNDKAEILAAWNAEYGIGEPKHEAKPACPGCGHVIPWPFVPEQKIAKGRQAKCPACGEPWCWTVRDGRVVLGSASLEEPNAEYGIGEGA